MSAIGGVSTTSAKMYFDPNINQSYFNGKLSIGNTSPVAELDVMNILGGNTPLLSVASSTNGLATSTAFYISSSGNTFVGTSSTVVTNELSVQNINNSTNIQNWYSNLGVSKATLDNLGNFAVNGAMSTAGQLNANYNLGIDFNNGYQSHNYANLSSNTSGDFVFGVSNNAINGGIFSAMFISGLTGNVGIGTSSPSANLHVRGNVGTTITGTAHVAATNGSTAVTGVGTTFTTDFAVGDAIKIGTSTVVYTVQSISSDTSLTLTSNYTGSTGTLLAGYKDPNNLLAIDNGLGVNRLTLTRPGNLGIGTTSPFAKLSILGTANGTTPLFAIATTTGNATTTVFQIDQNGILTMNTPGATSTITGNLYVNGALRSTTSYNGDLIFANGFRFTEASSTATPQSLYLQNQKGDSIFNVDENGNLNLLGDVCSGSSSCFGKSLNDLSASVSALASSTAQGQAVTISSLNTRISALESNNGTSMVDLQNRISALESLSSTTASSTAATCKFISEFYSNNRNRSS